VHTAACLAGLLRIVPLVNLEPCSPNTPTPKQKQSKDGLVLVDHQVLYDSYLRSPVFELPDTWGYLTLVPKSGLLPELEALTINDSWYPRYG
jgi:hypothetical protein